MARPRQGAALARLQEAWLRLESAAVPKWEEGGGREALAANYATSFNSQNVRSFKNLSAAHSIVVKSCCGVFINLIEKSTRVFCAQVGLPFLTEAPELILDLLVCPHTLAPTPTRAHCIDTFRVNSGGLGNSVV